MPFAFLPFKWAVLLWLAIGHILLFYSLWLILKIEKGRSSGEDALAGLFLVFSFWPLREELHLAQPDFFILFFLVSALFLLKKERLFLAGAVLGVVFQFREYLGILFLLFLLKKKWPLVIGIISSTVVLKLAAILLFGWTRETAYWEFTFSMFGRQVYQSMLNTSFFATLYRLGEKMWGGDLCFALGLICTGALIGKAVYWIRKSKDLTLEFCLFLALSFLVSPWVHEQHFVALYPAIIMLWARLEQKKNTKYFILFIVSYLFLGLRYSLMRFPQFHSGPLAVFTGGKLAGLLILFSLIGRLLKEDAENEIIGGHSG